MFETRNRQRGKDLKNYDTHLVNKDKSKKKSKCNPTYIMLSCIVIGITLVVIGVSSAKNNITQNAPLNNQIKTTKKNNNKRNTIDDRVNKDGILNTIYVGIPTLGDFGCPNTMKSIFTNALWPQNLYIGLYQQNDENDPDCLEFLNECDKSEDPDIKIPCKFRKNIKINRTTVVDGAKGPVYGRYMTMKHYEGQKYIIMMDSHTVFRKHWDLYLLSWYNNIDDDKRDYAMITHYPWGAESLERRTDKTSKKYKHEQYSYHICGTVIEGPPNYMPRNANGCFAKTNIDPKNDLNYKPIRTPFFGGGFSFVKSIFWLEHVKWDPYMLYIFNGEEFGISSRGWTSGYDFYSPPFDICAHWYDKGPKRKSPHINNPNINTHKLRDKSEKRINYMWGIWEQRYPSIDLTKMTNDEISKIVELRDLNKYNLGNKRTIEQYWRFTGIDIINKNITVFKEALYAQGGLQYVTWNEN